MPVAQYLHAESEALLHEPLAMTVQEAITAAERLLPGSVAPDGVVDARWQAIIAVGEFVEHVSDAIWPFTLRWGSHEDEDIRAVVATSFLEHMLERHFDRIFPRVEAAARSNVWFEKTTTQCWKFGQASDPRRAERVDRLCAEIREQSG